MDLFVAVFVGPSSWLLCCCVVARVCVVVVGLAGLGGWCVLVRALTELVVREVRLAQVIVEAAGEAVCGL